MEISAASGSMPSFFTASSTCGNVSGDESTSQLSPSSRRSSPPASMTAAIRSSSFALVFATTMYPRLVNIQATAFVSARLPACLVRI